MSTKDGSRQKREPGAKRTLPESTRVAKQRGAQASSAEQSGTAGRDGKGSTQIWALRLYVAGDSPKSRAALSNLQKLCDAHLAGQYEIEVIDLKTRPELAKVHEILAVPTLIRKVPEPVKRIIGDLSNAERALVGLEL
ncbi:MAG TPA: circadian clock KaiB family protein [Polyangiaceae bacterium]|nr:circadian clock KaiB family protein [Polyangiaceae bacterium]